LASSNPFDVSSGSGKSSPTKDENHSSAGSIAMLHHARVFTNGLEWQIAEGMFETTLSLASAYLRRGSVREAEYFIREAEQLATSFNAPAMICRALTMKVEVQLQLRQLDTALNTLRAATDTLNDIVNPDAAELRKLHGEYNELLLQNKDAQLLYTEALRMLEELDKMFSGLDARNGHEFPFLCRAELMIFLGDRAALYRVLSARRRVWSPQLQHFSLRSCDNIVSFSP
jgi:separase